MGYFLLFFFIFFALLSQFIMMAFFKPCVRRCTGLAMRRVDAASLSGIVNSSRLFTQSPRFLQSGDASQPSAMDIAIQINKLKKAHQGSAGPVKKEVELEAWKLLQKDLTEASIDAAEGKAVALLLNSWAYFAKHWERGKEGPLTAAEPQSEQPESSSAPKE